MDSLKKKEMEERRTSRESRRSSEGRRRTPLTSVFPEVRKSLEEVEIGNRMLRGEMTVDEEMVEERKFTYPILTIEEATADGHDRPDDWDEPIEDDDSANGEEMEEDEDKAAATPVKKARPRPVSEQMLGRSRPKPMYEDDEGVLSILDAATNDLALLINNLDLQATPSSAGGFTPLRPSPGSGIYEHSPTPVSTLEKPKSSNINGSPKRRQIIQPESPLTAKKAKASPGLLSRQMSTSSISSIRPYAQSRGYPSKKADTIQASNKNMENAALVNQNIVPWATLIKGLSPVKEKGTSTQKLSPSAYVPPTSSSTFRPSHKRTMTPGPEPEPELVLQPLRPARSRAALFQKDSMSRLLQLPSSPETVDSADLKPLAFNSSTGDIGVSDTFSGSLAPVFKRMNDEDHRRFGDNLNVSRSSRGGSSSKSSRSSYGSQIQTTFDDFAENRAPLTLQARRVHGMSGTLGGSDTSCYRLPSDADMDVSDPDSDVPDELKVILAGSEDRRSFMERDDAETGREGLDDEDTHEETGTNRLIVCRSERPPSLPLELPSLPIFHASLIDTHNNEQQLGLDCPSSPTSTAEQDIDHTNKSFDFTGELERLNSSGASDRRSFVEQLENAFKTPAKVDLRYAFDLDLIPPVPTIDLGRYANTVTTEGSNVLSEDESAVDRNSGSGFEYGLVPESVSQLVDMQLPSLSLMEKSGLNADSQNGTRSSFGMFSGANANSKLVDVKEPTDIHDDGDSIAEEGNTSRTSNGELNTSFRFGGLPRDDSMSLRSSHSNVDNKALTLSDIIPPPMHARALSITSSSKDLNDVDSFMLDELEDDSVLKSIYAKIMAGPLVKGTDTKVDQELKAKPRPTRKEQRDSRRSIYRAPSRPTSGISFEGFSSFDEVRRGFEFSRDRPAFYPPPLPNQSTSMNADFTFSFSATSNTSNANNVSSRRVPHRRHESALSFASVSSYGHVVLNAGSHDPFDYAQLPILRERPSNEDMTAISSIAMSMSVDDTFAHIRNHPRRRVDSDASSFYFKPTQRGHHRRESNMSVSSQAPPISLFNRSFGHRRNDSSVSASSVAMSYIRHGANGGISAWSRHRRFESNMSVDSIMSDFSAMHLGRPGLGDKMFDNDSYGHVPLPAISASPPGSARSDRSAFNDDSNTGHLEQYQSSSMSDRHPYDSIIDGPEEPKSSMVDSIFDKTGYQPHRSSVSSESLFGNNIGDDFVGYYGNNPSLFASNQYRPLSVLSRNSVHSPIKEDDTMISMLGGGHVRRRSVVEASPCARVEKRKHVNTAVRLIKGKDFDEDYHNNESPNKARVVEKPSIASTSSFQFGNERMIKAQRGLLERQSLEDSCLIADGEEAVIATATYHSAVPVFTRPVPPGRSRSSTCTSSSSGQDTPPLSNASDASSSDTSSISGGSQSSIDLSEINIALSNVTHPSVSRQSRTTGIGLRQRARARGTGHRRRYSNAHMSRSSVYETIEEEVASNANSGSVASSPSNSMSLPASITKNKLTSKDESPTTRQSIYIVDSDTASLSGIQGVDDGTEYTTTTWDDEHGIVALRKFYALRDEAQCTVSESRRVWKDTPFSVFAVQSFQAPGSPAGMRALLQHSVQTYGPLPSELRPHRVRSRTNSRASPYPKPQPSRLSKSSIASEQMIPVPMPLAAVAPDNKTPPIRILQDVTINPNTAPRPSKKSDAPSLAALKPFTPFNVDVKPKENGKGSKVEARPRVGSNARRTALGWTKRSNGPSAATGTVKKTSNGQKENINMDAIGAGTIMTPGENLRLNRPRPRGRPTPAGRTPASVKPIRI